MARRDGMPRLELISRHLASGSGCNARPLLLVTQEDFLSPPVIGRDLGQLGHQGHDKRLRYGLDEADRNRPVRVCDGGRSLRDAQMAARLPPGLKDPLRQALLSQNTGVGPGVGPDGFDHGGAFADALCVLCGRFPRTATMESTSSSTVFMIVRSPIGPRFASTA